MKVWRISAVTLDVLLLVRTAEIQLMRPKGADDHLKSPNACVLSSQPKAGLYMIRVSGERTYFHLSARGKKRNRTNV